MSIHVKFFASLRELQGQAEKQIPADGINTVNDIIIHHCNQQLPESTLIAINQVYAKADDTVSAGDEVAFFPPVTGG